MTFMNCSDQLKYSKKACRLFLGKHQKSRPSYRIISDLWLKTSSEISHLEVKLPQKIPYALGKQGDFFAEIWHA